MSRRPEAPGAIALGATEGARPQEAVLEDNWKRLRARSPRALDLGEAIRARWDKPVRFDDVPLLTDGYAPTDALLIG